MNSLKNQVHWNARVTEQNEFARSLLYVASLVCVPIMTACIQKGIASCR